MSAKSLYISHSEQHIKNSADYRWLRTQYRETEAELKQVDLGWLSFLISVVEKFVVGSEIDAASKPKESNVGLYWIEESTSRSPFDFSAPKLLSEGYSLHSRAKEISWIGFLFDLGHSLYIKGKIVYNKLRKLKAQLKYFLGQCKTHHFLLNHYATKSIRIHSMRISDKCGEYDIVFSSGKIISCNCINTSNEKRSNREFYSRYRQSNKF
jgi:hypothetical protein